MKLTPLDLIQQNFRKGFHGYESKEVDSFLELIRSEWEDILSEKERMERDLHAHKESIREFRQKEKTLQETLMTAQKLADDVRNSAKKESDIIISQAELQADKIIHQAHTRLTQIIDEITDLKRQRAEFEGKLRGVLESHLRLLELQYESREMAHLEDIAILPKQA